MIAPMILMSRKKPYKDKKYPERSRDVFVTQKMLYAVRDELKEDIKELGHGLRAEIANLASEIHQTRALAEEQNARNIAVIDALTSLFTRQDRVEKRIDEVDRTIATFRK